MNADAENAAVDTPTIPKQPPGTLRRIKTPGNRDSSDRKQHRGVLPNKIAVKARLGGGVLVGRQHKRQKTKTSNKRKMQEIGRRCSWWAEATRALDLARDSNHRQLMRDRLHEPPKGLPQTPPTTSQPNLSLSPQNTFKSSRI